MQQNKPIPSQQLPQCQICKYDPVPQSSQHLLLLILQICLIFVNWKFSIILLMLGYSFPQTHWKCPYCSRQIAVRKQNNTSDSIFLKAGKCMAVFSLNKFRLVTAAIIAWMLYLIVTQRLYNPKKYVTKTWLAMVQDCGFEVYMENSVRSNRVYNNYLDSGYDWEIEGIYLNRQSAGIQNFQNIFIKMNPTQFKEADAYDFKVFTKKAVDMHFTKGDIIRFKGEWQGRQYHNFIFNPVEIANTGRKGDPSSVAYLYDKNSLLRSHLDAVKAEYQPETKAQQIIAQPIIQTKKQETNKQVKLQLQTQKQN